MKTQIRGSKVQDKLLRASESFLPIVGSIICFRRVKKNISDAHWFINETNKQKEDKNK